MTTPDEKLQRAAGWLALAAVVLPLLALLGAAMDADWLRGLRVETPPMEINSALGLVLGGAALWAQRRGAAAFGTAGAAAMLALALATTLEHIFRLNLGIDEWFGHPRTAPAAFAPGRMPWHTTIAFVFASAALLSLRQRRHRDRWPVSAWLASVVVTIAIAALFALGLSQVIGTTRMLDIGTPQALSLALLGVGTLLARPADRPVRIFLSRDAAGLLGRRLFVGVAIVPTLLVLLFVALVRLRLIDVIDATLLLPLALMLGGIAVAFFSVDSAAALETARAEVEQQREMLTARLQEQAAQLQLTVAERTGALHEANLKLRAAAESNALLALVAHHTTNGVMVTDAAGRIEWVNAAFTRLTGYTLAEVHGRKPGTFLQGPGTDSATIARMHDAIAKGESCRVEILNYAKSGREFWHMVDIQPVRDASGQLLNFISVQHDISERRHATESLRQLNDRLRLATRSAALGVWEWDAATQTSTWDDRTFEIYGLRRTEYRGTLDEWSARLHPEDRARAESAVAAVFGGADEFEVEFRIIRAHDEAVRHIQSRAIVQRDFAGQLRRITGTDRDITEERAAARQLEALNERLRLALRSSRFGVWELDAETNRLTWDDRMFEIYELRRDEFDGSRDIWRACVHPEDYAKVQVLTRQVLDGELPSYDTEFRFVRRDGSVRHIEAHAYLQRDHEGRAVRFVGLNRDITTEKKMDEALALAEQRLQLALEGANDSVWDWDLATGALFHDQRWAPMLGYAPDEIGPTIDDWRRLAHPGDLRAAQAIQREHFAQRRPFYECELRMRAKNGEWKWILDRGKVFRRAPDGHPLRMVGTHSDITVRRRLEERLRKSEELAEQVSRLALIGGWEYDLESSQITWSDGMRRIHEVDENYTPTVAGSLAFYAPETVETVRAAMEAARDHGTSFDLEVPLLTARGRAIWVRLFGKVEQAQGRAVRLHGAMQDITAQHESEAARRELERQLFQVQKMDTLGTLAGGIAHDFNNLLTGIIGYHELAADSVPEDHPARAALAEARHASLRARELIEQILTFGRQSTGDGHVPLDLAVVAGEVRRFLRATLPAIVELDFHLAPDCPPILGDATQVHQVLINLASNAAHAMRQRGGKLTLTIAPTRLTPELSAQLSGNTAEIYVHIAVRDTGHGMDEATRRRIFDPFFTTKNVREGTGLGLAVVHGIVRAHRGVIEVESAPGAGATFHVYLPAAVVEGAMPTTDAPAAPRGAGEVVYVVDDEEVVGSCTKLVLENRGYQVNVFTSAEHCLAEFTQRPANCALLLTDQTMPGMQGTELIAAIRKLNPTLPVVLMSGYFSKINPQELDELGAIELLAKPFTTEELTAALHRALHPETLKS